MAVAGGTALAGCDPTGSDPAGTNLCYFQTESQRQLEEAFDQIVGAIVDETCDGQDNDCDDFVDNRTPGNPAALTRDVVSACGICVAECRAGVRSTCTVAGPCDDGDLCTTQDYCSEDTCTGTPVTCDDGNPCTADSCDPTSGCVREPAADGTHCTDGDPCTEGDTCQAGACVSGQDVCPETNGQPADGTPAGALDRGCGCAGSSHPWTLAVVLLLPLVVRRRR